MTNAEKKVYNAIIEFMLDNNYPPTVREIADTLGTKSACYTKECVERLRDEGFIDYEDGKSRTITIPGIIYADRRAKNGIQS